MARRKSREEEAAWAQRIGPRIDQAWQLARYADSAEMAEAAGLEYNSVRRWARGDVLPKVPALAAIAQACRVSLDWLILGEESNPAALVEWLESGIGQSAEPQAIAFLRSLPLHGYQVSQAFYDQAYLAWRNGLDPQQTMRTARLKR